METVLGKKIGTMRILKKFEKTKREKVKNTVAVFTIIFAISYLIVSIVTQKKFLVDFNSISWILMILAAANFYFIATEKPFKVTPENFVQIDFFQDFFNVTITGKMYRENKNTLKERKICEMTLINYKDIKSCVYKEKLKRFEIYYESGDAFLYAIKNDKITYENCKREIRKNKTIDFHIQEEYFDVKSFEKFSGLKVSIVKEV